MNNRGFSFIEIIVVLAIVAIISVLAAVFYSSFLTQNAVTNTTDHLISQFRKAQIYSMMSKQSGGQWGVQYSSTPTKAITFYLQGNNAFDETYSVNNNITISPEFNAYFGHPGGDVHGIATPFTITISGNNSTQSITINNQGVVSKN